MSKVMPIASLFLIVFLAGCPDSASKIKIEKSAISYEKPETSNQVLKGKHIDFELWYSDGQWKFYKEKNPTRKDTSDESKVSNILLSHTSDEVYVSIQETYDRMTYPESYKHYAKWVKGLKGQIIDKEIRRVNGSDILFTKSIVQADAKPYVSINYILTNKSGGVSVTAAVPEVSFENHKKEIYDLLNGLVDPSTDQRSSG